MADIGNALAGKPLLSIALGWDHARYQTLLRSDLRVQFVMPNTPAMVGKGVFLFEEATDLRADELSYFKDLFGAIGTVLSLPSSLMGIGGAISGCGPAFVDLMLEAFADAGVHQCAFGGVPGHLTLLAKKETENGL
jgi:pyrroline-5-carboxylate reductase